MRIKLIFIVIALMILTFPVNAFADKGIVIPWDNVVLSEPEQKAFIAHNGQEELFILSTDVKASESVPVLEFIPLPAQPEVSLAKEDCLASLKKLVDRYNLRYPPVYRIMSFEAKDGGGATTSAPVELLFHQKLGVHQVIAVKINDLDGFASWVKDYLQKNKIPYRPLNQFENDLWMKILPGEIKVFINNSLLTFGVPPQIINDRCFVPARETFTAMGATVNWDAIKREAVIQKDRLELRFPVDPRLFTGHDANGQKVSCGYHVAYFNGKMVILEKPPRLIEGRLLFPLRLAVESLGAKVEWDDHARAVYIYYEEPAAKEQEAVTSILKKFFGCLQQGDFAQAGALFEPDPDDINWHWIRWTPLSRQIF